MALTPEQLAELHALLGVKPKPRLAKPKVVVSDDRVIRDADVGPLSPTDPNAKGGKDRVAVRRADGWGEFRVDPAYERAWHEREYDKALDRQQRRALDPCRLGLYGPTPDEDWEA